jgi:hypothetical protein
VDSPLVLPPTMRTMPPSPLLAPTAKPILPADEASPVAMLASPDTPLDFPVLKNTGPLDLPVALPTTTEPLGPDALAPEDIDKVPPAADAPAAPPADSAMSAPRPAADEPDAIDIAPALSVLLPVPIAIMPLLPPDVDDPVSTSMAPLEPDAPPLPVPMSTRPPAESEALVLPDKSDTLPPMPHTPLPTIRTMFPPAPQ